MAGYTFEDVDTGKREVVVMSMHDAVPFGDTIKRGKRTLRRIADMGQRPIVKANVAHVAKTLPWGKREDGSPAIKGADGYTPEGRPIVESQATIDRIRRQNPEYGLGYGEDVIESECEQALNEVPE